MPMPVKDAIPHRLPVSGARRGALDEVLEWAEPDVPEAFNLYVETAYVNAGYVEGE